jgi:hypothetical protein
MQPHSLHPIREAIASGEFGRAQSLWSERANSLADELRSGTLTAARLEEVRHLVEWSRTAVLCERAHLLRQLNSLHIATEYEAETPAPTHRLAEASF